jgi:hypothetical protein
MTPTFAALQLDADDSKVLKKRLKKIKQKLEAISSEYVFKSSLPSVPLSVKKGVAETVEGLNTFLFSMDASEEKDVTRLESKVDDFNFFLQQAEGDYLFNEICKTGLIERLVNSIFELEMELTNHIRYLSFSF